MMNVHAPFERETATLQLLSSSARSRNDCDDDREFEAFPQFWVSQPQSSRVHWMHSEWKSRKKKSSRDSSDLIFVPIFARASFFLSLLSMVPRDRNKNFRLFCEYSQEEQKVGEEWNIFFNLRPLPIYFHSKSKKALLRSVKRIFSRVFSVCCTHTRKRFLISSSAIDFLTLPKDAWSIHQMLIPYTEQHEMFF